MPPGRLHAISITSGVEISPENEVDRAEELIRRLREKYTVPIGVSVYPTRGFHPQAQKCRC
jgi:hypothetical protein